MTLLFDPRDPYPLLDPASHTYAEAQAHAAEVDRWLGLDTAAVEASLPLEDLRATGQQLWLDLPVPAMLTPYTELRWLLTRLDPSRGSKVIDLGAGYGRLAFVIMRHHPGVSFLGYELVAARVEAARRVLRTAPPSDIRLECADLAVANFAPAPADLYFLYDYGTRDAIEKTLEDLRHVARHRGITVAARGRASRDAIDHRHPWLSQVVRPEHHAHVSIYRSR